MVPSNGTKTGEGLPERTIIEGEGLGAGDKEEAAGQMIRETH